MSNPTSIHPSSMKKLEGKVAIITGGASGIGEATARHFSDHGARAMVIADVQEEKGRQVAASIGCTFVNCDVTDEQQVKSLVESTVQIHGRLDIIFSNAGVLSKWGKQGMLDFDLDACDDLFAVNVRGMAACVKYAAHAMVEGGVKGSIVCTGSVATTLGGAMNIDYILSKHAVLELVRSASKGLGEYGIRVNCVSPAAVATPAVCNAMHTSTEEVKKIFEVFNWLKGGVVKERHVADAVVYLASEDCAFVTGHNLVVDGWLSTTTA